MLQFRRAGNGTLPKHLGFVRLEADRSANRLDVAFCKAALFLALLLLSACGGGGGGAGGGGGGGGAVVLTSIAITPANPTRQVGTNVQLNATGTNSDGTTRDLTASANWTSSATQVATVSPSGLVSALAAGSATITATSGGISTSTIVTVTGPTATLAYIHNFQTDRQTNGPLLQASDGNFYGTTRAGGANSCGGGAFCGTVFRLTPAGIETILYSFGASASDGFSPTAPLIQGSDGALYGVTSFGGAHGAGAVFRITLAGGYTVLYSFGASPSDGAVPVGGLIQASDGNFYGATASGGTNHCVQIPQAGANCGTVFRITPAGVATIVYSFGSSPSDGVTPNGSLLQASDGNFYGTTVNGGANSCSSSGETNNCGTAFRITPAGVATVLHSFGTSLIDGIAPQGHLIQGSDGAFYGTTASGGGGICGNIFGCGTVFRMTAAGNTTILYAFATTNFRADGYYPTPFLIQASDGNFYGTTGSGGASQADLAGTVFRLTPSGVKTILYSFGPLSPSTNPSNPVGGLIQGSDGAFYGLTFYGGATGAGTIFRLVVQ
jgi:uncharacterized repeat protein (TIGR03803 family)